MILKSVVKKFIERERRDFRVYKDFSDAKLLRRRDRLPVRPPIWNKLQRHQKVCLLIGAETKRFLFFNDTGTGKTLLCIALARYFQKAGIAARMLVLVPNRSNRDEWELEIQKHSPRTPYLIMRGGSAAKWEKLANTDAVLVVDTYMGIVRMLCTKKPGKGRKKKKMRLVPNRTLVNKFVKQFGGAFMDESTWVKNKKRLPFRICRQIAKRAEIMFGLAAVPFGRDPSDMWAQAFLIDRGYTLGENMALFRAAFCKENATPWATTYAFDKKKKGELNRILANVSIRYDADSSDLPKARDIPVLCRLPEDAEAYYERAKEAIIRARGDYTEMKNAFMRMRQISSGFVGYRDDESGTRAQFEFPTNPKLDALIAKIESVDPRHKIIVYHDFIYSADMITRELKALKIGHARLDGATKDTKAVRNMFNTDPRCRVLLLVNSMGIGLNLQAARYGMYYEAPVPVITRYQTRKRIERQFSEHKSVFFYDFIMRGTVDERILQFHKEGRDLFESIVHAKGSRREALVA